MTAPLTPAGCDLRDFPFMPLHVARLRDSDLAAEAAPEACWYAVLLWAASWHQIPAASLPDNDAALARLIGLGRDLRTFRKHKADAMRGFVLCADGRLYHPIVADQARAAWESKLQQRWRSECARIKKQNQRHDTDLPQPSFEEWLASGGLENCPAPVPAPVPRDNPQNQQGQSLQGTGRGTETGRIEEDADASLVSPTPKPKARQRRRDYPAEFEAAWTAYPHFPGRSSKPNALDEWLRLPAEEQAGLLGCIERFRPNVEKTCGGKGAPDMARWLKHGKHLAWVAAKAVNRFQPFPDIEIRNAVVSAKDEDWAVSWLDPCAWSEDQRLVVPRNGFAAATLRREVGRVIEARRATIGDLQA